jgi:hypothetical protein
VHFYLNRAKVSCYAHPSRGNQVKLIVSNSVLNYRAHSSVLVNQGNFEINIMHTGWGSEKLTKIFRGLFCMVVCDKFEYKYN